MLTFWAVLVFLINGVPIYSVQIPVGGDSFQSCHPFAEKLAENALDQLRKRKLLYVDVDAFCQIRGTEL